MSRYPIPVLFVLLCFFASPGLSQKPLSVADLQEKVEALKDTSAEKPFLVAALQSAKAEAASKEAAADFGARSAKALAEVKTLKEAVLKPVPELSAIEVPEEFDLLEKKTQEVAAERTAAVQAETALAEEGAKREAALVTLPAEIAQAQQELTTSSLRSAPPKSDAAYASWLGEQAARFALEAKLEEKKAELDYIKKSEPWMAIRRDLLARETARLTRDSNFYTQKLSEAREARAAQAIQEATAAAEAAKKDGNLDTEAIAEETLRITNLRTGPDGLLTRISDVTESTAQLEAQVQQIGDQYASAKRRLDLLESAGLTIDEETGESLRQQRLLIPSVSDLTRKIGMGVREAAINQLDLIKLEEELRQLLVDFNKGSNEAVTDEKVMELRVAQREALITAVRDAHSLQTALESRNRGLKQLIDQSAVFRNYLNEKLVWIRSVSPLSWRDFPREVRGVIEFFGSSTLGAWLEGLWSDIRSAPVLWILAVGGIAYFNWRRPRLNALIDLDGKIAAQRSCRYMKPTFRALICSLIQIALGVAPFWFLIWRTNRGASPITAGLISVATVFSILLLFRVLNQTPHGLMSAHLGRKKTLSKEVRHTATWMALLVPVPLFFSTVLPGTGESGRLFFIVTMVIILFAIHRLLHPVKGVLHGIGLESPYSRIVYVFAHAAPIALIIGSALGYYSSMRSISAQLLTTVVILFIIAFVAALLHRWVLVSRRKVAARQAAAKRKAEADIEEAKSSEGVSAQVAVQSLQEIENTAASLAKVQDDTRKLIQILAVTTALIGVWAVWAPSLPALSALDRVKLWDAHSVAASVTQSSGSADAETVSIPGISTSSATDSGASDVKEKGGGTASSGKKFVSLQDLVVALFLLILFFFLTRQLPSIMELLIFQRLNLEPGGAFAVSTILRYLLIGIGIVMVCSRLEIEWSKIQWIAAAITFGIGFGLQEIFANFVAGIIILFERPIRLGDFVTLDSVSGHVTKIRIRATTVRDFSNKELVVPNREFITGKLVNWTLSDPVIRIEVPVGIAYGSDTRLAEKVLLQIASENVNVIEFPEPAVAFLNFGESSLDLELRVHIKDSNVLNPVQSQLRFEIDRAFREAGIEISFPQRDLHIRSIDAQVTEAINKIRSTDR